MISYPVYKVMHLLGIFMVFLSLGGVLLWFGSGGSRDHSWRKRIAITHGVGLLLVLVGGFGLLARLGIAHGGLPGWIWAKLGIWTILGGVIALAPRIPKLTQPIWWAVLLLGGTAAWLAGSKPF